MNRSDRKSGALLGLHELLEPARRGHYGVGAYNFCNAETVQAVVEEGCALRSPVMLIISPGEIALLGTRTVMMLVEATAADADLPVCLHLDHANTPAEVRECIEGGFRSVMIDASRLDFAENVRVTKSVVDMAHPLGVTVEGELGAVGRIGESSVEGVESASLTDPARAAEFVERTGVDALAVSIGNAHGMYTQRPELDFERLQAIRNATDAFLVLHGGSGTAPDQLQKAIDLGITKINVASELCHAYLAAVKEAVERTDGKIWYSMALEEAKKAVRENVGRWMRQLGSAGKA